MSGSGTTTLSPTQLHGALEQHRDWLRSVVLARLGEPQAVDDVMQEVALAVTGNKAPLARADRVGPWLYQIAVRQTLLYRRKCGRRRRLVDRFADRFLPRESHDRELNPLEWLLCRERSSRFRQTMELLSSRDREILMLKYGQNWSYKRIAEQLGISESAVEARLHRARLRLRKLLAEADVIES